MSGYETSSPPKARLPWFPWIGKRPFYGWIIVAAGATTQFVMGIVNQGFSTYLGHLQPEFGWSRAVLAGPRSITQINNSVLGPIEGFLVDRIGPRIMVITGTALMGSGLILFGITHSLWMYYLSNIIIAIGCGFQSMLVISVVINQWFRRKRSLTQSFMLSGYALAGIIGIPVLVLAQTAVGWRTAAIVTGFIIWTIGFPCALYLLKKPEMYGLLPDGDIPRQFSQASDAKFYDNAEYDFTLREALRTRAFWFLALNWALGNFGMSSVHTHIFLHLGQGVKLEPAATAMVWSITCISNIPARIISGYAGDRNPKYLILGTATAIMAIAVFILAMANSLSMAIAFALLYGIGWGARTPVINAMQGDYFGRKSQGFIRGWLVLVSLPFAIAAPVICGLLADIQGDYRLSFTVMSIVTVLGSVFAFLATPPKHPQTGQQLPFNS